MNSLILHRWHLNVYNFLTGRNGDVVTREYTAILQSPLDSDSWMLLGDRMTDDQILKGIVTLVSMLSDSWRRLSFRFKCNPWKWLELATFLDQTPAQTNATWTA